MKFINEFLIVVLITKHTISSISSDFLRVAAMKQHIYASFNAMFAANETRLSVFEIGPSYLNKLKT